MTKTQTIDLKWTCEICLKPVSGSKGALTMKASDLKAALESEKEFNDTVAASGGFATGSQLLDLHTARWRSVHIACDANHNDAWWIHVGRVPNLQSLAHTAAHLMEKEWLHVTDFDLVMYEAVLGVKEWYHGDKPLRVEPAHRIEVTV